MIKVTVLYPDTAGTKFDHSYYANTHIPLVQKLLGSDLKGSGIEKGISGGAPGAPAPYHCIGSLLFNSVEDFQSAFGPKAGEIMADIPNFTDIQPVIQISEVVA